MKNTIHHRLRGLLALAAGMLLSGSFLSLRAGDLTFPDNPQTTDSYTQLLQRQTYLLNLLSKGGAAATAATAETKLASSVTTTSATVLTTTGATLWADIVNTGTVTVHLSFGGTAVAGQSYPLAAGQTYHLSGDTRFTGPVAAIVLSGTGTLAIQEHH